MQKGLKKHIIGWDIINWGQSLKVFEKNIEFKNIESALEIGASKNGGYSLYFASKGIDTICSNRDGDFNKARLIHNSYPFFDKIEYQKIDALEIPYKDKFNCIAFKSILGHKFLDKDNNSDRFKNLDLQKKIFRQISDALKSHGYLIFADNIVGTNLHKFINNKYGWGQDHSGWRYFTICS